MAKRKTKRKTAKRTAKRSAKRKTTKRKTAKKAARRKTAKRKPAKRKASKGRSKPKSTVKVKITRKVLGKAPEEYNFVLHDGRRLESVYELVDELETMGEDAFRHYVNEAENHFANWVEHVFDEKHLASHMRRMQNKIDTQRALLKHLVRELLHEVKQKAKP